MKPMMAIAVGVFSAATLSLVACGQSPQSARTTQPVLAATHAKAALHTTFDVDCVPVLNQIIDDSVALQQTPAFKQLAATPEYEAVMHDSDALDENHCDDADAGAGCAALRKQYATDEDRMMHTPQYQTLTATQEYKTLEGHLAEAQTLGCIE